MVVRFIQIVARGSRLDRGSGISAAEHERLLRESPEDAGAVDFIKILNDGRELPVLEENYERLPEARRGPVRYYRRERPRLADIEVWQAGEDLARDLVGRGGSISSVPEFDNAPDQMFDGDVRTSFKAKYAIPDAVETFQARIVVDMGSFFWVRGVQFILRLFGASNNFSMDDYRVDFSERLPAGRRQPQMGDRGRVGGDPQIQGFLSAPSPDADPPDEGRVVPPRLRTGEGPLSAHRLPACGRSDQKDAVQRHPPLFGAEDIQRGIPAGGHPGVPPDGPARHPHT